MILLRLFKNNRAAGMAGIFVLTIALFIPSFINQGDINPTAGMPFYNLVFGSIHQVPVLSRLIALIFILVMGYMLIRIGVRYLLLNFRSFMPATFFILFNLALPPNHQVNAILIGSLFYLLCFAILFSVHDKRPDTYTVFAAGLVLVAGSMFYLKLVWFLPLIWISLGTMRSATWRELLYPVIAFILLGLFLFTWYWVVLNDATGFVELVNKNLSFTGAWPSLHYSTYLYFGFVFLLVVLASLYMINRFQVMKTVVQNIYQVLFYMFLAGILFFVIIARFDPCSLVFVSFPVAFILSIYFHRKKNPWMHELILWILLALLLFVQFTV